jgi:molybdenum cofactor synthesis domain-containing protein
MSERMRVGIMTISDRCSRAEAEDLSGPAITDLCVERLGAEIVFRSVLADEADAIEAEVRAWTATANALDLLLTTGGTGLSPRDVTPEAVSRVIERPIPALMELARLRCLESSPRAFLSRGVAGVARRTLVVTLPGSPKGATETLGALLDLLPHAVAMVRGERGDHAR